MMDPTGQFECIVSDDNIYAIRNNATGEVRVMLCYDFDMEVFTEDCWIAMG